MKISELGIASDGARSFEIRTGTISYRALLRCIRRIPGTVITKAWTHPIIDDVVIIVKYKDITITIDTPFSDYHVTCASSSASFDEFVSKLGSYQVKWWEHIT